MLSVSCSQRKATILFNGDECETVANYKTTIDAETSEMVLVRTDVSPDAPYKPFFYPNREAPYPITNDLCENGRPVETKQLKKIFINLKKMGIE